MMTTSLQRNEAARWLSQRDDFVILTHAIPDGDTTGCSAALCRGLRQLGKRAWILKNEDLTPKFAALHEGLTKDAPAEGDTLVSVDIPAPHLLPASAKPLADRISLRIDHHFSVNHFSPFELVDPDAGACGDIVYDVLMELGVRLDQAMGEALYTAVSTDTGGFRYANTNAHSFRTAMACVEAGADIHSINLAMFETNSLARLRIQGWIVENLRFSQEGKAAVCAIPREVEIRMGATRDDMDNISGFPRTVEGVRIAATLREGEAGEVKLSVRALPGYNAAAVCERFGGGGHKGAAGATLHMTLEEAAEAVEKAMPDVS